MKQKGCHTNDSGTALDFILYFHKPIFRFSCVHSSFERFFLSLIPPKIWNNGKRCIPILLIIQVDTLYTFWQKPRFILSSWCGNALSNPTIVWTSSGYLWAHNWASMPKMEWASICMVGFHQPISKLGESAVK